MVSLDSTLIKCGSIPARLSAWDTMYALVNLHNKVNCLRLVHVTSSILVRVSLFWCVFAANCRIKQYYSVYTRPLNWFKNRFNY